MSHLFQSSVEGYGVGNQDLLPHCSFAESCNRQGSCVPSESRQLTWLHYLYDATEDPFPVYPFDLNCLTSLQHPIVPFRDIFKILGMAEVGFHVWNVTGLRFLIAGGERNTFRLMD